MSKIRVYELAKELERSSKELITLLMEEFGVEVKNHMSVIEEEDAELIKQAQRNAIMRDPNMAAASLVGA